MDVSWSIGKPIESMVKYGDERGDDIAVTSEYLDTVFLKGYAYSHVYVVLQVGRWYDTARKELIEVQIPSSPRQLLDAIHAFYHRTVSLEFIETLRISDGLNYECDDASQMIADGGHASNLILMGELTNFEGLKRLDDNVYRVSLGS